MQPFELTNFSEFIKIFTYIFRAVYNFMCFKGSQMVVTYLSEESDRANVLSRLGVSYGIGMVVGPSLGGFVTSKFG